MYFCRTMRLLDNCTSTTIPANTTRCARTDKTATGGLGTASVETNTCRSSICFDLSFHRVQSTLNMGCWLVANQGVSTQDASKCLYTLDTIRILLRSRGQLLSLPKNPASFCKQYSSVLRRDLTEGVICFPAIANCSAVMIAENAFGFIAQTL